MNSALKLHVHAQWTLEAKEKIELNTLIRLLTVLDKAKSLAAAAQMMALSYRHAWGLIRQAEQALGMDLIHTSRRKGSRLSDFALQLIHHYRLVDQDVQIHLQQEQHRLQQQLHQLYQSESSLLRLHASHGFAVEGIMRHTAVPQQLHIELKYRTGLEALAALNQGDCDVAGFEVPIGEYQSLVLEAYKDMLGSQPLALLFLAQRNVGLFVQPTNPLNIKSMADFNRPEVRVVSRQAGSGSRRLMDLLLQSQGLSAELILNNAVTEFTHMAVAAHIASGMADVGFGLETAAQRCGLAFIPLAQQRYFFAFHRDKVNSVTIRAFIQLLRSAEYKHYMQQLLGYDAKGMGTLYTVSQAFNDFL